MNDIITVTIHRIDGTKSVIKMERDELDAQNLFHKSIVEYKAAGEEKRLEMINYIVSYLWQHELAMKSIGTGWAPKFVKGGLRFLRWVRMFDKSMMDKYIQSKIGGGEAMTHLSENIWKINVEKFGS